MTSTKKYTTFLIAAALMFALMFSLFAVPSSNAHTPPQNVKTYAFVTASPNPVGVGQQVIIVFWLNWLIPTAQGTTGDRWRGFALDITGPNGTTEHVGPIDSDPVGSSYIVYTPTTVGQYNITFNFPGQVLSRTGPTGLIGPDSDYVNDTFTASSSNTTLTVQQEPIPSWVEPPLPVSYWTRPIDSMNTNWYVLASNWLGQSEFGATYLRYQKDGRAPDTAHVMWTKPLSFGGVVGGPNVGAPDMTFYSGTAYQFRFANPLIMYGRLFYSLPLANAPTGGGYASVDLRTGQTIWQKDFGASVSGFGGLSANTPSFGQFYDFESPNQHGVNPNGYLWISGTINGRGITNPAPNATPTNGSYTQAVTNANATVSTQGWIAIDPMTGASLFNETDVPTGTRFWGPQGEVMLMNIGRANNTAPYTYMWQWNNTKLPGNDIAGGITQWLPGVTNWNMSKSYDFNVTLSQPLPAGSTTAIIQVMPGDLVFGRSSALQFAGSTGGAFGTPDPYTLWAININASRGPIGQVMWLRNYTGSNELTILIGPRDQETEMFTTYYKETMQWNGYSLLTGEKVWGPTAPEEAFNFYGGTTGLTAPYAIGYGHLYSTGYSGVTYCYDFKTGNTLFTYGNNANDPHNSTRTGETAYGDYPYQVAAVADGKVYLICSEHSLNAPPFKGAETRCINASTGQEIWRMLGMCNWQEVAVADGYFVYLNYNDMKIYCVGPGPSATSLTAQSVITKGAGLLITGSVTDQSPNTALTGTPAISDHDQGQWMDYMLMKNIAKPAVQGVPVRLTAIDPNNNTVNIGTVTSDASGLFSTLWTPEIAGPYTVTASFDGSGSYGPSSAEVAVGVAEAPQATNQPGGGSQQQTDTTPILIVAAAAVALAIIAIIVAVALRRR